MKRKITAILLSMLMLLVPLTSAVYAEVTVTETDLSVTYSDKPFIHHIKLGSYYNSDTIAAAGEAVDASTWHAGIYEKNFSGLLRHLLDNAATGDLVNFTGVKGADIGVTENYFDFYIPASVRAGKALDSILITKDNTNGEKNQTFSNPSVTIDLENIQTEAINLGINFFHGHHIKYTVNYTDGTSVTNDGNDAYAYTLEGEYATMLANREMYFLDTTSIRNFNAVGGWANHIVIGDADADGTYTVEQLGSGGDQGIMGVTIPTDVNKIVDSITIEDFNNWNKQGLIQIFAVAQCELTNESILASLDAFVAKGYEVGDKFTIAQANEIRKAVSYIDILDERGVSTADYGIVLDLYDSLEASLSYVDANNNSIYHIKLDDYYNSDSIAGVGDEIDPKTWYNGLFLSSYSGFPRSNMDGKSVGDIVNFTGVRGWDVGVAENAFGFYIPSSVRAGGALDAVLITKASTNSEANKGYVNPSVTIDLENINTKAINLAFNFLWGHHIDYTVNYADGTSVTNDGHGSIYNALDGDYAPTLANRGSTFQDTTETHLINAVGDFLPMYYPTDPESDGTYVFAQGEGSGDKGIIGVTIPADSTKVVDSITVTDANNWAQGGFYQIFAAAQIGLSDADVRAALDSFDISSYSGKKYFTIAETAEIEKAAGYIAILEERGLSTEAYSDIVELVEKSANAVALVDANNSSIYHAKLAMNADTVAPVSTDDVPVYTTKPELWFAGDYSAPGNYNLAGLIDGFAIGTNDVTTVNGVKYEDPGTNGWLYVDDATRSFTFYTPSKGKSAGVADALRVKKDSTKTVPLAQVGGTDSIMLMVRGSTKLGFTINYADGSSEYKESNGRMDTNWNFDHKSQISLLQDESADVRVVGGNWNWPSTPHACLDTVQDESGNYVPNVDEDGKVKILSTTIGGGYLAVKALKVKVDPAKVPVSVKIHAISVNVDDNGLNVYGLSQTTISDEEMIAYIDEVSAEIEAAGLLTDEQIEKIEKAAGYASILIGKGADESEYDDILALKAKVEAQKPLKENYSVEIPYNVDRVVETGETITDLSIYKGQILKKDLAPGKDYVTIREINYVDNDGVDSWEIGEDRYIKYPDSLKQAGVKDALYLGTSESATLSLKAMPTEKITLAVADIELGDAWFKVTVNYSDGTSSQTAQFALPANNTAWYYGDATSFKVVQSKLTLQNGGTGFVGMTDEIIWHPSLNESNVVDEKLTYDRHGFLVYDYMTETGKIPESVTVTASNPFTVYAIEQAPYNDIEAMTALLDKYDGAELSDVDKFQGIGIEDIEGRTDEEAMVAYNWNKALVDYKVIDETAYPNIPNYITQAQSQENVIVDLTDNYNAELLVKAGNTPVNALRDDYLYNFDLLPESRMIGDYKFGPIGNNAVKVEKTSSTNITVDVPDYDNKIKNFGVILDTVEIGNSSISTVPVTVTYTDGSSENVDVNLYRPDSYAPTGYPVAVENVWFNRMYIAEGLYALKPVEAGINPFGLYPSEIPVDITKTVASLTFNSISVDYNILAITGFSYTNAELDKISYENDAALDEITKTNAQSVIKTNTAIVELYNRGFTLYVTAAMASEAEAKIVKANEVLAGGDDTTEKVLSFDAVVDFSDTKAVGTVTMVNTTDADQDYILVIAAYNGDKLLNLSIGTQSTLYKDTPSTTKTISMNKEASATKYKVLIWKSLDSLEPLGTSE